ncbi:adenosylcobinamide-GDP ribazoletransferase [Pseudorhodoferax sp. Leaf267]|uniref:adenosylcobinamide-GDP ribazoletransferase n=1 Tax=Pseudorhodoferax sp. Leaf267 TaxID=1736316 RepID=UPI0006FB88E2|nr:adenosylcobinamide-GDP ribazoletransferase [Pseudorhodoferax sp. Leaf267]KQP23274.1 cobalamin synthase [Pseudorhodoferax sp. Leaf267]
MQGVRHFLLALQFFTRVPVTGRLAAWVGFSPTMLRSAAAHFPGVGWLVAGVACAVAAVLWHALPVGGQAPLAVAALSTVATVLLTGGFHEDGLADVADGLGGSQDRARALEIMKDSRIGAFGAMALVLGLVTKVALLAVLGTAGLAPLLAALLGAHVLSRWLPLLLPTLLPHVGDTARSKSKPLADQVSRGSLLCATLWCLPALLAVAWWQGPAFSVGASLAALLAAGWMFRLFRRRLQGFTGDCLGATQQVCEIAFYLGAALVLGRT